MSWSYYEKDQVLTDLMTGKVFTTGRIKEKDHVETQKRFLDLLHQRYKNVKSTCAKLNPMTLKSFVQVKHIYWMKNQHIAYQEEIRDTKYYFYTEKEIEYT